MSKDDHPVSVVVFVLILILILFPYLSTPVVLQRPERGESEVFWAPGAGTSFLTDGGAGYRERWIS